MFYRRSLAKKFLGTDDPAEVQKHFSTWENFLKTVRAMKEKSFGRLTIVSTIEDLEAKTSQWSGGWFEAMKDELENEDGKSIRTFCYFLPTWGLHYTLKPNSGNTDGDWAMIQGPVPYYWGGSWLAANKNARNPTLAKDFIKYICIDENFQTAWAKDTGDIVSNLNVINKIKNVYSEPFLAGQNHYDEFSKSLPKIHDKNRQSTDQIVEALFADAVKSYVEGNLTKEQAMNTFKKSVAQKLTVSY